MLLSRLVALLFVLAVAAFVMLATLTKDPGEAATRLPADLSVENITIPAEPFDALASAYQDFDPALAGTATRTRLVETIAPLLSAAQGLTAEEVASAVTQAVDRLVSDEDINAFNALLTAHEEKGRQKSANVLILSPQEQSLVNFGNAIGEKAIEVMLTLQTTGIELYQEGPDSAPAAFALRPRLTRPQRVAYQPIAVETYVPRVNVTGSTSASRRAQIRARTSSVVQEVLAKPGDFVEAGQPLLILDNDGRDAQRAQLLAGVVQAEANVVAAQAAIGSAQAQIHQAKTSLSDARQTRADVLALGDFASQTQRRNATSAVDQAVQALNIATGGLAQAEANLAQRQASLESARANLVQIDLDIARLTITAPFAGRIEARNVEIGGSVTSGSTIFTLADLTTMKATARVSDSLRQTLGLGEDVSVTVGNGDTAQTFSGPITLIDTRSDASTRTFAVEVELTNHFTRGQPAIVDNQFATLTFAQAPREVLRIPQSSLTSASIDTDREGTTGLMTVNDENAVTFTEITFADYNNGGELLIHADRLGGQDIRLIVGRVGFVKIGDVVDARAQHPS